MSHATKTDLLAPFEIWEVQLGNRTIKFFEPLLLTPCWLEDDPDTPDDPPVVRREYLGAERPDLEIFANGTNRRELWNSICSDIRSAWVHFVQPESPRLSRHGIRIKENYLRIAEEVDNE
ncbi:MAG: hypothetical protein LBI05_01545 [Planctomycetaceae bacterium]|jgi:hypothetical protein|nr:hypothetical protein [Planctomycetaceae bacterium]